MFYNSIFGIIVKNVIPLTRLKVFVGILVWSLDIINYLVNKLYWHFLE